jgi:hypothetical protein
MKKNFLICGLGNIGYRHAQSIVNNIHVKRIYIYDKDIISYDKFLSKFNTFQKKKFFILKKLYKKDLNFYLVIIATNSTGRYNILDQISKSFRVEHVLLEKFLEDKIKNLKLLKKKFYNKKIFVNYTWRYFPASKIIKKNIKKNNDFLIRFEGKSWNMASNALHIVDMIKYILNANVNNIELKKNTKLINSKRKGFKEVLGTIVFNLSNKIKISLNSFDKNIKKRLIISHQTKKIIYEIDDNTLLLKNKKIKKMEMTPVSKSTNLILSYLLKRKYEKLSKLDECIDDSILYLSQINQRFKKTNIKIT